ncbi:hypothetical protein PENSPDRAFT_651874 [Peniophora sp. CONT]|nr:hypothetical protein PENSPDRAFT_651874 [Peniophora sp. CONT]
MPVAAEGRIQIYSRTGLISASTVPDVPPGHTLKEMIPSDGPRYNRQTFVEDEHYTFEVPPLCLNFPQGDPYDDWNDPDLHGWEPHTHPEGSLYFYHREKRIFTEAYIYLPSYLEEVEQLVAYLQQLSQAQPAAPLPADYELVVQITFDKSEVTGEKGILWQYYYVDHKTRGLFWLRPFEVGEHLIAVCGEVFPAHFKHMLETWYWDHVALFPDNFESHDYLVEEVIGHLTFFGIDVMTASTTTVQYSLKEVTNMIQLLGTKEPGAGAVPIAAALGRIMADFCHWRFLHYHGQRWARLSRLESARKSTIRVSHSTRTWTMKLFFVLFLHAPEGHIRDIEKVFVDGLVTAYAWKRYITKLRGEWEELVTYAAIMLTASVSMLSVPDVILFPDDSNSPGGDSGIQSYLTPIRSPAAIANYVAIICSIGSVVTGLILLRNNRSRHDDDLPEAVDYMRQQRSPRYHFEPLAILYSAPYALLMWAMLSFSASVLIFTLVKTDIATQSTVVVMSSVVAALVAWCIARFIDIWEWDVWKRAVELCRTAMKRLRLRRLGCSLRENGLSNTPENAASSPSGTLGHVSRIHWCSLTKKMRQTKIPCINDV